MGLFLTMLPFLMLKAAAIRAIITELKTPPPTRSDTNGANDQQEKV